MFSFLNDLCESHLIPSQISLKKWKAKDLAELAYLYLLSLTILMNDDKTKQWAEGYCKKTAEPNDFLQWRASGNDLYVLLHALSDDPDNADSKITHEVRINPSLLRTWLRNSNGKTRNLFTRLDAMFHITNSSMKSLRRIISEWKDADDKEQQDTLTKLTQLIHTRAPSNSEVLPHLKKLIQIDESASMGATGAANVATAVGGLGAGFDPDDEWRSVFPKKKKPVVLRR